MKGMTLLEVLVALVVFATASLTVLSSVSQHTRHIGHLETKTFATLVADNALAELALQNKLVATRQEGSSELAGRTWYWRLVPEPTTNGYLQALDLFVFSDQGRENSLAGVRTYVPK